MCGALGVWEVFVGDRGGNKAGNEGRKASARRRGGRKRRDGEAEGRRVSGGLRGDGSCFLRGLGPCALCRRGMVHVGQFQLLTVTYCFLGLARQFHFPLMRFYENVNKMGAYTFEFIWKTGRFFLRIKQAAWM